MPSTHSTPKTSARAELRSRVSLSTLSSSPSLRGRGFERPSSLDPTNRTVKENRRRFRAVRREFAPLDPRNQMCRQSLPDHTKLRVIDEADRDDVEPHRATTHA